MTVVNTTSHLKSQLESIGILATETWIQHMLSHGISDINQLITVFLNSDLYSGMTFDEALPQCEASPELFLQRPIVLQIEELVNIGAPLEHRQSEQNATFKMFLTDGHRSVIGLLLDRIPGISWNTPIGGKILVREAYIGRGLLLLHSRNCKYIGGKEILRDDPSSSPANNGDPSTSEDQPP